MDACKAPPPSHKQTRLHHVHPADKCRTRDINLVRACGHSQLSDLESGFPNAGTHVMTSFWEGAVCRLFKEKPSPGMTDLRDMDGLGKKVVPFMD